MMFQAIRLQERISPALNAELAFFWLIIRTGHIAEIAIIQSFSERLDLIGVTQFRRGDYFFLYFSIYI